MASPILDCAVPPGLNVFGLARHANTSMSYSFAGLIAGYATIGALESLKLRLVQLIDNRKV
jgi:hypothetical protein